MTEETYAKLAEILERSGFEQALELINNELVPLVKEHRISVDAAMLMYENGGEEQDTAQYQLWLAMREISEVDHALYQTLDIFTPL